MTKRVEITEDELALILQALEDAAFYRDTRSRVLKSAAKRGSRRSLSSPAGPTATDVHQGRAQVYAALAVNLKTRR